MKIFSIDPGNENSAYVILENDEVIEANKVPNTVLLKTLQSNLPDGLLVVEQIACMGMAVGAEVFETVFWSGRFCEAWGMRPWMRLKRHQVKMHLCGNMRAKDANIRQALIDRFGPGKEKAIGTKRAQGPLYGISGDEWSALAIAVTVSDKPELIEVTSKEST